METIYLVVYAYCDDRPLTYCNTLEDAERYIRIYREIHGKLASTLGIRELTAPNPLVFEDETFYKSVEHAKTRERRNKMMWTEYQGHLKEYGKDNADFIWSFWNRVNKFQLAFRWIDPDFHLKQCAILSSLRDDVERYEAITGENLDEYLDYIMDE